MPDIDSLRTNTSVAARGAFGRGLISKAVLHRLQDGTVSKYDVQEARQLYEEKKAIVRSMGRNGQEKTEAFRLAIAKQRAAYELSSAVENQYEKQGYVETGAENTKDWWNGAAW